MKTSVLIADAARARFFRVMAPDDDGYDAGPRLRELEVLVNPEGQLTGSELYGNLKSGRHRAPRGGPAHGLDDHRERHDREIDDRFMQRVAQATGEHVREERVRRVVLVAPPRSLGKLRALMGTELPSNVKLEGLDKEVTAKTLSAIEGVLEGHGLLAPRVLPEDIHRPPGQPLP
jgi:protein required for attachment to host cells